MRGCGVGCRVTPRLQIIFSFPEKYGGKGQITELPSFIFMEGGGTPHVGDRGLSIGRPFLKTRSKSTVSLELLIQDHCASSPAKS